MSTAESAAVSLPRVGNQTCPTVQITAALQIGTRSIGLSSAMEEALGPYKMRVAGCELPGQLGRIKYEYFTKIRSTGSESRS
jgi:hypothetical protein